MKKVKIAVVLLALIVPFVSFAATDIPKTFPSIGRGIRPLGMGNSFITMKGQDANGMFYNPAAISDYDLNLTWTTGFIPPQFEFNYGAIKLTKDIFNLQDDLKAATTSAQKTVVFDNFVNAHRGKFYDISLHMPIIGVYNRYFALSLISDDTFALSFRDQSSVNFQLQSTSYTGLQLGSAYKFFDDNLSIGAAAKVLYGIGTSQVITETTVTTNNLDNLKWKNWQRGLGIGFDVGAKYDIPDFGSDILDTLKPAVGVTWQNIGNTKFRWMKKNGGPDKLQQSVSAGLGIHPVFGTIETSLNADFRELNIDESFIMKTNFGAEARFRDLLIFTPSIRAGLNQGYPSVGAGLDIGVFTWNVAFFGKEVGQTKRTKGSYVIANEFSFRF